MHICIYTNINLLQNVKLLTEEALQTAEKRRESKNKEETERCKHLNSDFQRRARRNKKAFLGIECKDIEENNKMGKIRSLQENQRYKGTSHAKMGSLKDRNGMDLTEAEDIKRWQEHTELYKKRSSYPR